MASYRKDCERIERGNRTPFAFTRTVVGMCFALLLSSLVAASAAAADAPFKLQHEQHEQQQQQGEPRSLAIGDFASLNELFSEASIAIPNAQIREKVAGFTLGLDLTNGACQGISVGDVTVQWFRRNNREIAATVNLIDFDIVCQLDYEYSYILGTNGNGVVDVFTKDNTATALLVFGSPNFDTDPPDTFEVERCEPQINVFDLDFEGSGRLNLVANLLNAIERQIRGTVANAIEDFLCQFFRDADDEIAALFGKVTGLLDPYVSTDGPVDPLAVEQGLVVPADVALLDFQNPGSNFASVIDILVEELGRFFGKEVSDGSGGKDLNINVLLRDFALESDGALKVDLASISGLGDGLLFEGSNLLGEIDIAVQSVAIYGLDSFTRFDDLAQLGGQTLGTTFAMDSLSVILGVELELRPPAGGASTKRVVETANLQLDLDPITVTTALLLAVDEDKLGALQIGSLLTSDEVLSCLFTTLFKLAVTELTVTTVTVSGIDVSGLESPGLQRLLSTGFDITYTMFEAALQNALPGFLQIYILDLLNDALEARYSVSFCPAPRLASNTNDTFIDFRELLLAPEDSLEYGASGTEPYDSVASFAKKFVDDELSKVDSLNDSLIGPYTEKQSGTRGMLVFDDNLVEVDTNVNIGGFDGRVEFRLSNVRLQNLDSLGSPLSLLDPVLGEANILNNTATGGAFTSPAPLRIAGTLLIAITSDDTSIRNEMDIGIDLRSANVVATVALKMQKQNLFSFRVKDIFDFDCWLATMPAPVLDAFGVRVEGTEPTLSLPKLSVLVQDMNFTLECIDCSSPMFQEIPVLLESSETREDATKSANNVLDFILSLAEGDDSFLQTQIDRYLVEAPKRCPHRPEYDPVASEKTTQYAAVPADFDTEDSFEFLIALVVTTVFVILGFIVVATGVHWFVGRRHRKWLKSLTDERVLVIYREQHAEDEKEVEMNALTQPMFRSNALPALVRYMVPVILVANIGLFLSGHLSLGGSVRIYLQIGDDELVIDDFYSFSIAQSAIELWNAGAKELAFLMLLFSGVWPYTKQIATLVLWFLPSRICSVSRRGTILLWLDALAKWSMVDVFVMIVSIVAFRVTIKSPEQSFLPDDLYRVELLVVPLWGLYANMIAQLLSQVTSHAIIYYHRRIIHAAAAEHGLEADGVSADNKDTPVEESQVQELNEDQPEGAVSGTGAATAAATLESDDDEEPECLYRHSYVRPHRGESEKLFLRRGVNATVMVISLALVIFVLVGCILPSISFDAQGVVGVAVESGQDFNQAFKEFSVVGIANLLMEEARFLDTAKDKIGLGSIASLLVVTTLIVPTMLAISLLLQWFYPLKRATRGKISIAVETLQAWQYVEVYLVATIVGAWQIGDVSEFLVNSYCTEFQDSFNELVFFGILDAEDAQCFRVQAAVEAAAIILIVAATLLNLLNLFVSKAVLQFNRDKDAEASEPLEHSVSEKEDAAERIGQIHPVPVLFTDRFRWFLRREQ